MIGTAASVVTLLGTVVAFLLSLGQLTPAGRRIRRIEQLVKLKDTVPAAAADAYGRLVDDEIKRLSERLEAPRTAVVTLAAGTGVTAMLISFGNFITNSITLIDGEETSPVWGIFTIDSGEIFIGAGLVAALATVVALIGTLPWAELANKWTTWNEGRPGRKQSRATKKLGKAKAKAAKPPRRQGRRPPTPAGTTTPTDTSVGRPGNA